MGEVLAKRIKQSHFESSVQELTLNLLVSAAHLRTTLDRACVLHGVTLGQYNVLRILRGAHPNGYPRREIIGRMLEPAPDVTRLIDRLERDGFVTRCQSEMDKRRSIATITEKGLQQLQEMQPDINQVLLMMGTKFTDDELSTFNAFCERIYG